MSRLHRLHLTDARLWNGNTLSDFWADKCIDGSLVSGCVNAVYSAPPSKWFSARVDEDSTDSKRPVVSHVALYLYRPWGGMQLAPFEVWLGSAPGVANVTVDGGVSVHGDAVLCAGPIVDEPSHQGTPLMVECCAAAVSAQRTRDLRHVTVRHIGAPRGFYLSELVVYELAALPPATSTLPRPPPLAVVVDLNERWRRGQPSNDTRDAGVLVHMFDAYEDWAHGRPWAIAAGSGYDHFSCSMANVDRPGVYPSANGAGIALAADVSVLCAYMGDSGTGSAPNGACDRDPAATSLYAAMSAQPTHWWHFNEVILGSLDWAEGLPGLIEAVLITKLDNAHGIEQAQTFREDFARHYGIMLPVVTYDVFRGFNLTIL